VKPVVVLAGLGPLGLAIVERLAAAGVEVRAVAAPAEAAVATELDRLGARLVTGSACSARVLEAAGLASATACVLAADNDAENVDAALLIRRHRADLPLVVRVFDPDLTSYLRDTVARVTVLSTSGLGAPVFADLTLRALAERSPAGTPVAPAVVTPPPKGWRHPGVDRELVRIFLGLGVIVAACALYFAHALNLRLIDALYFVWTTATTVGYGDIALRDASDMAKVVGMGLMFAGAAFIAALYALFTGTVVARRLDAIRGRVPVRGRGHIVVAGAGHVGLRVTRILASHGHRMVVVERDGESRHVSMLRAEGHHVIVADASVDETLDLARVDHAAAVVALTDSDASNLHLALAVRRRRPDVPVVVRLASAELAAHVVARHDAVAASTLALASEAFAHAALAACGASPAAAGPR
jgi:Trk K+ transport system NAD-binding subunit